MTLPILTLHEQELR